MDDFSLPLNDGLAGVIVFMTRNGTILLWLFAVTCLLWTVIVERLLYYGAGSQTDIRRALDVWSGRKERKSWYARKIRTAMLSQVRLNLTRGLTVVRTLTIICPLLGLLGTLIALIAVFDRIALLGVGDTAGIAEIISLAAIPAMAGMIVALSGIFAHFYLRRRAQHAVSFLEDRLGLDR